MCTVTFLPTEKNGFILTSNRDERKTRKKAFLPRKFNINNLSVFYPKDAEAGGTWIVTSNNHFTLCLLNGGLKKHVSTPPYKYSRGLVVLDFFHFNDVEQFTSNYDFKGIEPFTLVIVHSPAELKLTEVVWDGEKIVSVKKDQSKPHIWSSATLYEEAVIKQRRKWFDEWLADNQSFDTEKTMLFHEFGGTGNKQNDLVMNRNDVVLTVSITCIDKSIAGTSMKYKDMIEKRLYNFHII